MLWSRQLGIGLVLAGALLCGGIGAVWASDAANIDTPATLAGELRPHMRIHRPEGEGPFPTVLQFHGCGSQYAAQDGWAEYLAESGFQSVIVDSLGPRDIGRMGAITTVCTALRLRGLQRSGDVLAALHAVQEMDDVDLDNLFLAGWSHGGWTLMDLFTLDLANDAPAGLEDVDPAALSQIRGVLLVYPYCGVITRSASDAWHTEIDTLMITGGRDTVAPARSCEQAAERLNENGSSIERVHFDDATHAFDVNIKELFQRGEYDEALTQEARDQAVEFFRTRMLLP